MDLAPVGLQLDSNKAGLGAGQMKDEQSKAPELEDLKRERQLKKLRLFLCTDNPIWAQLLDLDKVAGDEIGPAPRRGKPIVIQRPSPSSRHEPLVAICAKHLGVTGEWRRDALAGDIPDPNATRGRITGLIERLSAFARADRVANVGTRSYEAAADAEALCEKLQGFVRSFDEGDPVYAAARALGMGVDACQMALDKLIFSHGSLLRSPFFGSDSKAQEVATRYLQGLRGVYFAYLRRDVQGSPDSHLFLRCALRVRYLLRLQGGHVIRVKLNMPQVSPPHDLVRLAALLHDEPPLIEYDGFCFPKDRCHLVMEERSLKSDADMISIVFDTTQNAAGHMHGRYLTVGQDPARSIATDDVVLERIPESEFSDADEEMRGKIMRRSARVFRQGDHGFERIDALFQKPVALGL